MSLPTITSQDSTGIYQKKAPKSITDESRNQGLGTPTSPLAAKTAGGSPMQAAMTGSSAQKGNVVSSPPPPRSQQLQFQERYQSAAPATDPQKLAQEKMDRLKSLGGVATQVESLIAQKTQNLQNQQAQIQTASQSLAALPDDEIRQQAELALAQYAANPTEENLQAVYDTLGQARLEEGGISNFYQDAEESLKQLTASQFTEVPVLENLNLEEIGVDTNQLATALGVDETALLGMTVEDLRDRVEAVRAQEFSSLNQLQAALYDPTLPPAQRQEILQQLKQAGAAGIPGVEIAAAELENQIAQGNTVDFAGMEMSLEEAFSDEGMSRLIAEATLDENLRNKLRDDPRYTGLADWIETNKEMLDSVVADYAAQTDDFVQLQQTYRDLQKSLGEDSAEIFELLTGEEITNSILSGDFELLEMQLTSNPVYQAAINNPRLLTEMKENPSLVEKLMDSQMTMGEIQGAFELRDNLQSDPTFKEITGIDTDIITDPDVLAQAQAAWERYNDVADEVKMNPLIQKYMENGTIDYNELIRLDDMTMEDFDQTMESLQRFEEFKSFRNKIERAEDPQDALYTDLFGYSDFSGRDLQYGISQIPSPKVRQEAMAIFDLDGDGQLTDEEVRSEQALAKLMDMLGVNTTADDILGGEEYNPEKVKDLLGKAAAAPGSFEKAARLEIAKEANTQIADLLQEAGPDPEATLLPELEIQEKTYKDRVNNKLDEWISSVSSQFNTLKSIGVTSKDHEELVKRLQWMKEGKISFQPSYIKELLPSGINIPGFEETAKELLETRKNIEDRRKDIKSKIANYNIAQRKVKQQKQLLEKLDTLSEEDLDKLMKDLGISL